MPKSALTIEQHYARAMLLGMSFMPGLHYYFPDDASLDPWVEDRLDAETLEPITLAQARHSESRWTYDP